MEENQKKEQTMKIIKPAVIGQTFNPEAEIVYDVVDYLKAMGCLMTHRGYKFGEDEADEALADLEVILVEPKATDQD